MKISITLDIKQSVQQDSFCFDIADICFKRHMLRENDTLTVDDTGTVFKHPDSQRESSVQAKTGWKKQLDEKAFCGKCHCLRDYDPKTAVCQTCSKPIWEVLAKRKAKP